MKTWVTGSQWCPPPSASSLFYWYKRLQRQRSEEMKWKQTLDPTRVKITTLCPKCCTLQSCATMIWNALESESLLILEDKVTFKTTLIPKCWTTQSELNYSLTWWANQSSLNLGRNFKWTTANCISSKDGCDPTSSSNGNLYSSMGPGDRNTQIGIASGSAL